HLPFASPWATTVALQALASIGGDGTGEFLRPYLDAPEPQVRVAALQGLRQLGDATVRQRAASLLDDPDVQVCAAALLAVLAETHGPEHARAYERWESMLSTVDPPPQVAAISVMEEVSETPLKSHVYHAPKHTDIVVRHAALRVLHNLATAGRI